MGMRVGGSFFLAGGEGRDVMGADGSRVKE